MLERNYLPRVAGFTRSGSTSEEPSKLSLTHGRSSTDQLGRRGRALEKFALSWHNMSLTLGGATILRNATGKVQSGTVSAIVSSEPAGTVALLETLSDRGYASRYKHLLKLDVRVNDRVVDTHRHSYPLF